MEAGLAGARRSVTTAAGNEERLGKELAELEQQADQLTEEARDCLRPADEWAARLALFASRRWPTWSAASNNSSRRLTRRVST